MKFVKTIILFLLFGSTYAQIDSTHFIKVHFLYGSKPKKKFPKEVKYFGGLHGGHVSIQVGNMDYGFEPTDRVHILPHRHNPKSVYVDNIVKGQMRYDTTSKVTTFIIPLTTEQLNKLNQINLGYCKKAPYDYAFFGMRCASTAQDVLGQIGVVKKRGRFSNIVTTFYPKKLRKRLFKLAAKNSYTIVQRHGRASRKWEKD
jgi:hypothetical protein